ncbi:MAG: tetratricopeptide repeat protein [Bacteroidia bacterium]|nr:tetratricopeptide repeat protein [Bacteroidia bacterium]
MMRNILITGCLILNFGANAQLTEIYREEDKAYKNAWELYIKEKYSAAKEGFGLYLNQKNGSEHNRINAAFYAAVCSYELFNPDAENLLSAFTAKHPESTKAPLAWFYLGRHYYRTKKYIKALPAFEKADVYYLSGEEVPEYYFKTGYCYFNKGDNDQAAKKFHEILQVKSKYQTAAQYYYGHIAYSNNNYKTALEYFSKLDSSATFGPLVPYYITQMYFEQGKYDDVIQYAVPVLENRSPQNNAEIMRIVAESYYRKGEFKKALVYFDGYSQATPVLSRDDRYTIAFCEYKSGNYENAIHHFEKVVGPQDSLEQNAWYHLADCYLKTNNKASARNAFQFASKLDHNKSIQEAALFNYAKLCYELKLPGGLPAFRDFLTRYPNSRHADEANELLAELYMSTRNYKDALIALDNVKNKSTATKAAYQKVAYFRGIELNNDGENDKAIGLFEKAILNDVDPDLRAKAIYWKAEILYKQEKYEAAIKQYRTFIFNPGSVNTPMYNLANYNVGYCYFKQNNYSESQSWFRKYLSKRGTESASIVHDALLRTGDCYYAMREFESALQYYNDAISDKAASSDYALFQRGVIQGLQGNVEAKSQTLTSLLSAYPRSRYRADALFERGRALMTKGESDKARENFSLLLREYPNSQYAKRSQLNIGLIHYNDQQDELALEQFKKVISTYPGTPEATEALTSVRNIYVSDGKPDLYFAYVKNIPNASVSTGAQDSITYEAAEQRYLRSNFDEASKDFEKYLQQFPNGAYRLNATFYKAECDYRNKNFGEALKGYEIVSAESKNIYTEKSLLKAAEINFNNKAYQKAIEQYSRLEQMAELRDNILAAQAGLMRASYHFANYGQATAYAQKLIDGEKVSNELVAEAHLIFGRAALQLNDYSAAKREYTIVSKQSGVAGAEAKYSLALIDYKMGNFKASQNKCYDVANLVPSYDFWIAKSFILLSDNHIALKDTFQAKATLQSILENYEKDPADPEDIRAIAKEKLDDLLLIEMNEMKKPEEQSDPETDLNKEQKN